MKQNTERPSAGAAEGWGERGARGRRGAPRRSDSGTALSGEATGAPLAMSTPQRTRPSPRLLSGFSTQGCKRGKGRGPRGRERKEGKHICIRGPGKTKLTQQRGAHTHSDLPWCAHGGQGGTGETARPAAPRAEQATRAPGQEVRFSRAELSAWPDRWQLRA